MISQHKSLLTTLSLCLTLSLSSCGTLAYYQQSVRGHLKMMHASEDIDVLLKASDTTPALKKRLRLVTRIRNFASQVLLLPENQSYRRYADIGRKYIVWNVVATSSLSLVPEQSCFLIVGCLSYRGYFNYKEAAAYAQNMENQGLDVYLGGVSAYSTLGWFDDPVLNGMLDRSDSNLARLIFHELAHQFLYIKNDTEFNEAFADSVALIGVNLWLDSFVNEAEKAAFASDLEQEQRFTNLVLTYQNKLRQLYQSDLSEESKLRTKSVIYDELYEEYRDSRHEWDENNEYGPWFENKLNNAKISAISTYRSLLPVFLAAFESSGKDLQEYYKLIQKISDCDTNKRREHLHSASAPDNC